MRREKVILEMLARIQALEKEVAELKAALGQADASADLQPEVPHRTNSKVTNEMLDACYEAGKLAAGSDDVDVPSLARQVHLQTGMNQNNAQMTVFAVVALLNGELYKRCISGKAVARFFDCILRDYDGGGLQRAIAAVRLHIKYRRALHHNVDLLEQLCDQYQQML